MYIIINDIIGEKRINLSYPIHRKEIAVISVFSDNIQHEVVKPCTIIANILGEEKLILSRTYKCKELIFVLEGVIELTQLVNDD